MQSAIKRVRYDKVNIAKRKVITAAVGNIEQVRAERCRRSYFYFMQQFWEDVVPNDTPRWNWHIKYLAEQLQELAILVGANKPKLHDLIINMPPGETKSITCSIMFPVWCWTRWPWMRFISSSYSSALSLEHAEYSRELVRSDKFQRYFPELSIKRDKDTKSNFRIEKITYGDNWSILSVAPGGNRYSTAVKGTLTGFHGHILIVDDPLDPNRSVSVVEINSANRWIDQTLSTRKVDKTITPTILVQQRLHQDDPSGHILAKKKKKILHICLPGEIRSYKDEVSPPELANYYVDDLLNPSRMDWEVLSELEKDLGQYGYAGQIGQRPTPPGGGMFKVDHFHQIDVMPVAVSIIETVRYWDKAGSSGTGAWTVGSKVHKLKSGKFIVSDIERGQWSTDEREKIIRETAEADGRDVRIMIEQEPGPIWEEELIQMADGKLIPLKDIIPGNLIINMYGVPTVVKQVHNQGELETIKIFTDSGREIVASLEHPVFTPKGWVLAKDLLIGNVLGLRTNIKTIPESFPTNEECRLAGYFVGDGCCTKIKGANSCNANVVSSDVLQGKDIIVCGESVGAKVNLGGSKGWTYYMSLGIRDWLRERDLFGKRTETKVVPEWVMSASNEKVANFIGAYFGCDGSAMNGKHHPAIEFYSVNKRLLKEVSSLLLRFGIYTMLRERKRRNSDHWKTRRRMYRLTTRRSDDSMAKFSERIPVYGLKKYKLDFKRKCFEQDFLPDPITEIIPNGKVPCRCLTVKEGDSFIVSDFVVHNSGGKESKEATIRNLAGFVCDADLPRGDKVYRADPYSVQVNNGNILLLKGDWVYEFIEEHRFFPFGKYKDQVDATSAAFNDLNSGFTARAL